MITEIKLAQSRYEIEHPVEVGGEDRHLEGQISFDGKGNGSVSVKIKSGCLSYDEQEIEGIMQGAKKALLAGYLKLRDLKERHSREKEGSFGTGDLFNQPENEEDDYITMQEQAALVEAEDHNAEKSNIFKMAVEVEPGSLVDKIQKSKGERAAKV